MTFRRLLLRVAVMAAVLVATAGVALPARAATMPARVGDYNGDGRTDAAYFRPEPDGTGALWQTRYTGSSTTITLRNGWGQLRDEPVPGDYNGDGRTDIAVFRPWDGSWSVVYTGGNAGVLTNNWGVEGDIPVPGDYNGDGRDDMMVFRSFDGSWSVRYSNGGEQVLKSNWGILGDIPVSGDYDGDGRYDMMVWRPGDGSWSVAYNDGGHLALATFGSRDSIPVPGDYNGDRISDMLLYRPGIGAWDVRYTGYTNVQRLKTGWGGMDDMPVPGDYNGDGKSDMMIFRPRDGSWSVAHTSGGISVTQQTFGAIGDLALPTPTIPGVPSRSNGFNKPIYFVHGYAPYGPGASCSSYWARAIYDYRNNGDPAHLPLTTPDTTVGFYDGDEDCDAMLIDGPGANHDVPIEDLGRRFSWEIYNRYSRYGRAVDIVAHSMGGLIAMVAISGTALNLRGWAPYVYVEDVSALATPFTGVDGTGGLAALGCVLTHQCAQMRQGSSAYLAFQSTWSANNPQADGTGTDWTLIGSYDDPVVSEQSATAMASAGHKLAFYRQQPNGNSVTHASITEAFDGFYSFHFCHYHDDCNMNGDPAAWPVRTAFNGHPILESKYGTYNFSLY